MDEKFSNIYFSTKEEDEKLIKYYDEINTKEELMDKQDEILTYNIHVDENQNDSIHLIAMTLAVQNYMSSDSEHINVIVTSKEGNLRAYCYYDEKSEKTIFGILKCLAEVPEELQNKMIDVTLGYSEKDVNQQVLEFVRKSVHS
ncbi:MAG: hypothetical protein K6G52_01500 [Treponemataceae bacterium]|nr:hypothetical protein [Treponemataceae bacterium]